MIVTHFTLYACDNAFGCDKHFTVTNEADELRFQKLWFVGVTKQFCPEHRGSVRNQAVIVAEETLLDAIANRGLVKFKSIQEVENGNASNRRAA